MVTWSMPCVSSMLLKVTCPVYGCTVAYSGQVTFYKVQEKHGHVYVVGLSFLYHCYYQAFLYGNLCMNTEQLGRFHIGQCITKQ